MNKILTYAKLPAWVIIIGILCFTPGDEFKKVHITIPHFDKMVHFGMFFILAFLIKGLYWKDMISQLTYKSYLVLAVVYGVLIEIIQYNWIYMRSGDWVDWLFDCAGIIVSIAVFRFWPQKFKFIFG
jgi:VanZ family protein